MIIHTMEQGTDEWFAVKLGKFSATSFTGLLMAKSTQGWNDAVNKIVFERVTGTRQETYFNKAMQWGTEMEPEARRAYELATFQKVNQVGFVELNENVGCSPDGLISEDGLIEIKCPQPNTLIGYHISGKVPTNYNIQMQGQMWVTGRKWNIFYAWHPNLKPFEVLVERDEALIKRIETEIGIALIEVNKRIKLLK